MPRSRIFAKNTSSGFPFLSRKMGMWIPHLKLSGIQSNGMKHSQRACTKKPFVLERTHAKKADFVTQYSSLWKALSSLHLTLDLVCILTQKALWLALHFPFLLNTNDLFNICMGCRKSYAKNSSFNHYNFETWYYIAGIR